MIGKLLGRISRLSPVGLFGLALTGLVVVAGSAYYGYRTYEYVQYDNEFCLSCHLMREPYERFAVSAHRGLGCKACHTPTLAARSQMALTQILENPDSLAAHAEVPNEKCVACHVEGDPDRWVSIASSVGHRIHFESTDTVLEGLTCIECHSSSLHQFAPSDETCGQSGCHSETGIVLGAMSELTIHCAACHSFNAPVPRSEGPTTLSAAIRPHAEECLSCHVMRTLVELPSDEPHQGVCATCHNAHEHETPEEAGQTCASAACHAEPDTLTSYHRGLTEGVVADCTSCHSAHSWAAAGGECLACHLDIFDDARPGRGPRAAAGVAGMPPDGVVAVLAVAQSNGVRIAPSSVDPPSARGSPHRGTIEPPAGSVVSPVVLHQSADTVFRHAEHRGVDCLSCHSEEPTHGALTVNTITDCRSCHHTAPVSSDCAACHGGLDPAMTYPVLRTLDLSVADETRRELPFQHEAHTAIQCAECHTGGLELSARAVSCSDCHEEHHEADVSCVACHSEPNQEAHTVNAHAGCTASDCHSTEVSPFARVARTRQFCLVCHQGMADHRPENTCIACHPLPESRTGGAG